MSGVHCPLCMVAEPGNETQEGSRVPRDDVKGARDSGEELLEEVDLRRKRDRGVVRLFFPK